EQAVTLRLESAVVDGFRLLHFAEGPRTDQVRRGQRDLDRVEVQRLALLLEEVEQVFHGVLRKEEICVDGLSVTGGGAATSKAATPPRSVVFQFPDGGQRADFLHQYVEAFRLARDHLVITVG